MCDALSLNEIEDRARRIKNLPLSDWGEQNLWRAFWRGEFEREEIFWASYRANAMLEDAENFRIIDGERVQVDSYPPPGNNIPDCERLGTGDDDPRLTFWSLLGEGIGLREIDFGNKEAYFRQASELVLTTLSIKAREFARCLMISPVGLIRWCSKTGRVVPEFIQSINSGVAIGHEEDNTILLASQKIDALRSLESPSKAHDLKIEAGKPSVNSLANAEHDCREWLKTLNPKTNMPKNRDEMKKSARTKFPGLSQKAFLRAWGSCAPEEWKRPGRKKKTP